MTTDPVSAKPLQSPAPLSRKLSIAPMMDWTDRHCRYFLRQITHHTLLYTEMVTTGALIHGDRERFLRYHDIEHPIALQLGGSDTGDLAQSCKYAEQWGYDEVNLNVGCPSDRVQNGMIGACLMKEPKLVADCIKSMQDAVSIPVTIKHRIGVNGRESWEELVDFVGQVADTGCKTFIVHARIAILEGLSPKENRDIPPLKYDWAWRLKQVFPDLEIIVNGGITTLDETEEHLQHLDGVMIGREAYHNPWILAEADPRIFGAQKNSFSRNDIIEKMIPYAKNHIENGKHPLNHISRHMLGLFNGLPGARRFRRHLSEHAHKAGSCAELLREAASFCLSEDISFETRESGQQV
ncbi:tRNA dihydrouridine(20/20a) synthase DusA [Sansalvadorimonas sp. 2012CJ34-2]|uniref:tRNA-dihydrouridine(20/20a) synthase n=1 Tax=Parendozoicomonas callyspongiae TaxID=2942213 RepID=A0ABT0PLG5_9GAMM|nr:tRNA dihydrouridine(20/20a) synthase DusA [Sansalvadorimonas sp. 2012CJ34-2]MCL6272106.1 tRNA dihydrouridine(20/20a) synthase DusA [Sansalvadorimonas sp. 2012CJ34-2]